MLIDTYLSLTQISLQIVLHIIIFGKGFVRHLILWSLFGHFFSLVPVWMAKKKNSNITFSEVKIDDENRSPYFQIRRERGESKFRA